MAQYNRVNTHQEAYVRSRSIRTKMLLYASTFYICWNLLSVILLTPGCPLALKLVANALVPLMGFLNMLVFILPKCCSTRNRAPAPSSPRPTSTPSSRRRSPRSGDGPQHQCPLRHRLTPAHRLPRCRRRPPAQACGPSTPPSGLRALAGQEPGRRGRWQPPGLQGKRAMPWPRTGLDSWRRPIRRGPLL